MRLGARLISSGFGGRGATRSKQSESNYQGDSEEGHHFGLVPWLSNRDPGAKNYFQVTTAGRDPVWNAISHNIARNSAPF